MSASQQTRTAAFLCERLYCTMLKLLLLCKHPFGRPRSSCIGIANDETARHPIELYPRRLSRAFASTLGGKTPHSSSFLTAVQHRKPAAIPHRLVDCRILYSFPHYVSGVGTARGQPIASAVHSTSTSSLILECKPLVKLCCGDSLSTA